MSRSFINRTKDNKPNRYALQKIAGYNSYRLDNHTAFDDSNFRYRINFYFFGIKPIDWYKKNYPDFLMTRKAKLCERKRLKRELCQELKQLCIK